MDQKQIIDVHCHLFNGGYALAELTAASWNLLKGTYPRGEGRPLAQSRSFIRLEGITEFAAYAARLLDTVLSDSRGNYDTQRESLANSAMSGKEFLTVPLMMDIYYALDDNNRREDGTLESFRSIEANDPCEIGENEGTAFEQHLVNVRNLMANELASLPDRRERSAIGQADLTKRLDNEIEKLHQLYLGAQERTPRGGYGGIELSPGYRDHMQALEDLAKDHPGRILPFLAIDPRRRGIQQLIEMKIAKGQGVFKGVKLYPPLGYLPTHPKLEPVYAYCAQYDIPITVHCSLGGFENFRRQNLVESWTAEPHWESFTKSRKTKSMFYADPENWLPVLERWNNLRINFGHFGGSRAKKAGNVNLKWLDTILRLMRNYPNVYADLSYIANLERKEKTLEIIGQSELLKQRVMFGTDFIMLAMDRDLGGLTQYFTNYADLEDALLYENASRFLKLEGY